MWRKIRKKREIVATVDNDEDHGDVNDNNKNNN